ncbi:MAG: hypothetical protein COX19_12685 [Desulfobacterales bacterium CG23_combo_of_CG06-09_8_20_14_all_51_8]|nr:MAG: hypothetical protein COX19_12685 [Desulfobacterales bacterium CG23_combo_of_CG06-09_8_20_14_all_51_8]
MNKEPYTREPLMNKSKYGKTTVLMAVIALTLWASVRTAAADPVIINHTCTAIAQIPQSAIDQAKSVLHIAYGHTSHGSQLTDGMSGLVDFANNGGLGLNLPDDFSNGTTAAAAARWICTTMPWAGTQAIIRTGLTTPATIWVLRTLSPDEAPPIPTPM